VSRGSLLLQWYSVDGYTMTLARERFAQLVVGVRAGGGVVR
jgi:hypothetical protein